MAHDALRTAIDNAIVGSIHLTPYLGENPPPATATFAEGLAHYGGHPCLLFDLWLAWRGVARLAQVYGVWLDEVAPQPIGGRARTMME